jgi:antitoxin MazE
MDATVKKWGNSLAIRLPRAFADELGLTDGTAVDLSLTEDGLLLTPARPAPPRLKDLLSRVTRRNVHAEVKTGPAVGREVW